MFKQGASQIGLARAIHPQCIHTGPYIRSVYTQGHIHPVYTHRAIYIHSVYTQGHIHPVYTYRAIYIHSVYTATKAAQLAYLAQAQF